MPYKPRAQFLVVAVAASILCACGEPYRKEGQLYSEAANLALKQFASQSSANAQLYWNDCGKEVTCLFLYKTQDPLVVEAVAVNLIRAHSSIKQPGVKLTVYSSAHDEPKVLFREITIK